MSRPNATGDKIVKVFMESNTIVDLTGVNLNPPEVFFRLCECIKNHSLSEIKKEYNFNLCKIDGQKCTYLYDALATLTGDFKLNLSYNRLGSAGLAGIGAILTKNVRLKALSLDGIGLGDTGISRLMACLVECKSVSKLTLESNSISRDGIIMIANMLPQISSLSYISLNGNDLSEDKAVESICTGICGAQIRTANLANCRIQGESAKHLRMLIELSKSVTCLDISCNELRDEGAVHIGRGLKENLVLTKLNLGTNNISAVGTGCIVGDLLLNDTLRELDLSRSHASQECIGDEGAIKIADMLMLNRGIMTLNLYWQCIGTRGAIAIATALESNRTLQTLNLGGNYVGPDGIRKLENAMGIAEKVLSGTPPVTAWHGNVPSTPLLLNRRRTYFRQSFANTSGTNSVRSSSAHITPRSSLRSSFNGRSGRLSVNSARGTRPTIVAGRVIPGSSSLNTSPRVPGPATSPSSSQNGSNGRSPTRRTSQQFFESSFGGGRPEEVLPRRTSLTNTGVLPPTPHARRSANVPSLSSGIAAVTPHPVSVSTLASSHISDDENEEPPMSHQDIINSMKNMGLDNK